MQHCLECIVCAQRYNPDEVVYTCRNCGSLLDIHYEYEELIKYIDPAQWHKRPFGVWRYRELLPVDERYLVSLEEGGTSLQKCRRLAERVGLDNVYVKNEGENPTGSFKDRGMTVGVTKACSLGAKVVACASTGNTSASLAAYAAKAGLRAIVFVPSGKISLGKLSQAIAHGAEIIRLKDNFDAALRTVFNITLSNPDIYLLNSVNPYRIEGQKTAAFEIYQQLGNTVPDNLIVPVGNAGNISAIWKGFVELKKLGLAERLPRMMGIQAEGAAPIAHAFKKKASIVEPISYPETLATAIRIGAPASWRKALNAVYNSNGLVETVNDQEILNAQREIARLEGLFIEPASAASIAGLSKLSVQGEIERDQVTVCVATGHGLKDPDIVISRYELPSEVDFGSMRPEEVLKLLEVTL
ncbi:MAG: threonine synthase [Candidatus Bathyarchaeia archaeon]